MSNNSTFNRQQALERLLALHEGNCAHADGSCVKCLRAELAQVRDHLVQAREDLAKPRPLPAEFDGLAQAIDQLLIGKRLMPGVGGQQLGLETYSLRFSGVQYSSVIEHLSALRSAHLAPQPKNPEQAKQDFSWYGGQVDQNVIKTIVRMKREASAREAKQIESKQATKPMPARAGQPYTSEEDALVSDLYQSECTIKEIANVLERTEPGIAARLERLGLMSPDEVQHAGPAR